MFFVPVAKNKFNEFGYIELDNLYVGLSNVRIENAEDDEELNNLTQHIGVHGLLEPIVVFSKNDIDEFNELYESRKDIKEEYEILAGQRRWNAFKYLNKQSPRNGWDKIPCHIREPPDDEADAKAISLGEGLTQLPYTLTDIIEACDVLFKKFTDPKIVAKKTGISVTLVNRYVKFARLPKLLQDNLGVISKFPKTAVNLAVEAADALTWSKDSDVLDEKVFELAKKLGAKKKKSQVDYKKLKQAAEENPSESIEFIVDESLKIMNPKTYNIVLSAITSNRLDDVAEKHGNEPEDEATELIEFGLLKREGHSSD